MKWSMRSDGVLFFIGYVVLRELEKRALLSVGTGLWRCTDCNEQVLQHQSLILDLYTLSFFETKEKK